MDDDLKRSSGNCLQSLAKEESNTGRSAGDGCENPPNEQVMCNPAHCQLVQINKSDFLVPLQIQNLTRFNKIMQYLVSYSDEAENARVGTCLV